MRSSRHSLARKFGTTVAVFSLAVGVAACEEGESEGESPEVVEDGVGNENEDPEGAG